MKRRCGPLISGKSGSIKRICLLAITCLAAACSSGPDSEIEVVRLSPAQAEREARDIREEVSVTHMDGLEVSLWASERLLKDPVGLYMDDRGRAYVTGTTRRRSSMFDIRQFREWMTASLSFRSVADRRAFLHRELSPNRSDQNRWLPDRNGDGLHDWRDLTVEKESVYRISDRSGRGFADTSEELIRDFNNEDSDILGTVLEHRGDLYAGVAPDMWRFRDRNGDGIYEIKESISHGYGVHIGFGGHGVSGLRVGPDGRIYWSIGDVGLHSVDRDGKRWPFDGQGVIVRSEPDGSNFEVFASGLRNVHEFDFDNYGNLISVDNDGDHAGESERLVYLIDGSDSGWRINWQFGKYSDERNNDYKVWMDEGYHLPRFEDQAAHILPPLSHYHNGPAGLVFNPGTALDEQWQDHFFVAGFTGTPPRAELYAFTLKPDGVSFELERDQVIVEGILGTGLSFGPDGALYMADWIEGWQPTQEGRIWKIDTPGSAGSEVRQETQQLLGRSFKELDRHRLAELLGHADRRVRLKAQFELADRGDVDLLTGIAGTQDADQLSRIHSIWGLGQISRAETEVAAVLLPLLRDSDPVIRAMAARALGDARYRPGTDDLTPLLEDEEPRVRLLTLEALGRIGELSALEPIVDLLEREDDREVYFRQAGAIALSRIGDGESLGQLSGHPSAAVRVAAVVALKRLADPAVAAFLQDDDEYVVTNAARAINDEDFIEPALPDLARLVAGDRFINEPLMRRAINASLYSGTSEDAERLALLAERRDIPTAIREEALATLNVWEEPSLFDRVTGRYRGSHSNDPEMLYRALEPVLATLISDPEATIRASAARLVATAGYEPGRPLLGNLIRQDSEAEVRLAALEAALSFGGGDLEALFTTALNDSDPEVRNFALEMLPGMNIDGEVQVDLLADVIESGSLSERQTAVVTLGEIDHPASGQLMVQLIRDLREDRLDPRLWLEVTETASGFRSGSVAGALDEYRQETESELLDQYQEALSGGSAVHGERIFYENTASECIRCHAVAGDGGDAGPDLTTVASRLNRRELLLKLLDPSARIAPGYGVVTLNLNSGESTRGVYQGETETHVTVSSGEDTVEIEKAAISERSFMPSAMPVMRHVLSKQEMRDLVEFLSTLRQE